MRGHEARQGGTPPAPTKAHGQVPGNNGHQVRQTWTARTTCNEPRHRNRCQATPSSHTARPSQEWRGTSRARTQTHTHTQTPQPGVAGHSRNPSPSTHTHTAQDWRGQAERSHKHTHTHASTPTRRGGAQPRPKPKRTHPHRTLQPGVPGYCKGELRTGQDKVDFFCGPLQLAGSGLQQLCLNFVCCA